jgi:SAM-dependent methyltransferase
VLRELDLPGELTRPADYGYGQHMSTEEQRYLREVQYRHPDRLKARSLLHTCYGRGDWFDWLAGNIPLPPRGVIADVGCGAGAFWTNAPRTVPDDLKLRLFDLSPGMVEAADRAVADLNRWIDVRAEVADAAALPLGTGDADTVLAIHMLYHLSDPAAGVREFGRVVKPGGTVAVVLNPAGTMAELSSLIDAALKWIPGERQEPLTSDQALPLLQDTFRSVERIRFDDELAVTDPVDLLAYLLSLPIAEGEQAREALASAVSSAFTPGSAVFHISKAADLLICRP